MYLQECLLEMGIWIFSKHFMVLWNAGREIFGGLYSKSEDSGASGSPLLVIALPIIGCFIHGMFICSTQIRTQLKRKAYEDVGLPPPSEQSPKKQNTQHKQQQQQQNVVVEQQSAKKQERRGNVLICIKFL